MKYLGTITDPKDLVTKEYVDNVAVGGAVLSATDDGNGNVTLIVTPIPNADDNYY